MMESLESPVNSRSSYDHLFKLIIVGDSCVGKTSILQRFHGETFLPQSVPTIGIDFRIRTITYQNKIIKLQIWDTSGQEKYDSITTSYYRGALGVLLVYDITSSKSFDSIKTRWIKHINANTRKGVKIILIGNKCDVPTKRVVKSEIAEALAVNHGFKYFETSAKENINLETAFHEMAKDIYNEKCLREESKSVTLAETSGKKRKTNRCCQITINL
ncbi:ras-related protein Rab-10-like [Oppia nitens]|uniref:ras-related protein Rab-10-like n=1 Tax=Oppia nitens TaxID=1686743 RepID=UPI0023DB0CEE|nr:ras-related protein Rab-10-like [Oppia nitens]